MAPQLHSLCAVYIRCMDGKHIYQELVPGMTIHKARLLLARVEGQVDAFLLSSGQSVIKLSSVFEYVRQLNPTWPKALDKATYSPLKFATQPSQPGAFFPDSQIPFINGQPAVIEDLNPSVVETDLPERELPREQPLIIE